MKTGQQMVIRAAVLAAVVGVAAAVQAAYVELPDGKKIEGSGIRVRPNGDVLLTIAGRGEQTFTRQQYIRAVADKPPEIDKARQLIAAKQYDEAVKVLSDLAVQMKMLSWDAQARLLLGQIHMAKGEAPAAIEQYERIIKDYPDMRMEPTIFTPYLESLLAGRQFDKLNPMLDEAIAKADRDIAAKAQILRGDVKQAQGQFEAAVLDYLRTVYLFEAQKEAQPEALFKAAQVLEKLRDARAKELYRRVAQEYPSSPYAAKAKK
jgi:TolA-binding protein